MNVKTPKQISEYRNKCCNTKKNAEVDIHPQIKSITMTCFIIRPYIKVLYTFRVKHKDRHFLIHDSHIMIAVTLRDSEFSNCS